MNLVAPTNGTPQQFASVALQDNHSLPHSVKMCKRMLAAYGQAAKGSFALLTRMYACMHALGDDARYCRAPHESGCRLTLRHLGAARRGDYCDGSGVVVFACHIKYQIFCSCGTGTGVVVGGRPNNHNTAAATTIDRAPLQEQECTTPPVRLSWSPFFPPRRRRK